MEEMNSIVASGEEIPTTSEFVVPAGLRLLLDDIIHSMLGSTATETCYIYRLVADCLDKWLDQRTQLELVATRLPDNDRQ